MFCLWMNILLLNRILIKHSELMKTICFLHYTAQNHVAHNVKQIRIMISIWELWNCQHLHFYFCLLSGKFPWRSWINSFSRMLPHQAGRAGHPNNVISRVEGSYDTVSGKKHSHVPRQIGFLIIIPLSEFYYIFLFWIKDGESCSFYRQDSLNILTMSLVRYAVNNESTPLGPAPVMRV